MVKQIERNIPEFVGSNPNWVDEFFILYSVNSNLIQWALFVAINRQKLILTINVLMEDKPNAYAFLP